MSYALIWIQGIIAVGFLTALLVAFIARLRKRLIGTILGWTVCLLFAAAAGLCAWELAAWRRVGAISSTNFAFFFSFMIAAVGLAAVVLMRGLMRPRMDQRPRGATWSLFNLAVGATAFLTLTAITISNLDLAMQVRLASDRAESSLRVQALLPARPLEIDNAAVDYIQAMEGLPLNQTHLPEKWRESQRGWLDVTQPLDEKDTEIAAYLEANRIPLQFLRQGAAKRACWFDRDYSQSAHMLLPEVTQLHEGILKLALRARLNAKKGRMKEALSDLSTAFAVTGHIDTPFLVCLTIGSGLDRGLVRVLEEVLASGPITGDALDALTINDVHYAQKLRQAIRLEEAGINLPMMLALIHSHSIPHQTWPQLTRSPMPQWLVRSPLYRVFFLQDDLESHRRGMRVFQELSNEPYWEAHAKWNEALQDLGNQGGNLGTSLVIPAVRLFSSQELRLDELIARNDAYHRLARIAVASLHYRIRHGKDIEALGQLTPEYFPTIPMDPFQPEPLQLRVEPNALVFTSVGLDYPKTGSKPTDSSESAQRIEFRVPKRQPAK